MLNCHSATGLVAGGFETLLPSVTSPNLLDSLSRCVKIAAGTEPTLVSGSVHIVSSIGRWLKSCCPHCSDFGWPPRGRPERDQSATLVWLTRCFLTLGDCQPELFVQLQPMPLGR